MIVEDTEFYMIWTKRGYKPRYMHATFDAAMAEAERLAVENPNKKFIVLRAVKKLHLPDLPEVAEAFVSL